MFDFIKNTFYHVWYKVFSHSSEKSKRIREEEPNEARRIRKELYISATETRNFILNDPILDWFNRYGEANNFTKDSNSFQEHHTEFLLKRGNDFEDYVINFLKSIKGSLNFVDVKEKFPEFCQEGVQETKNLMKKGVDIIYQGFLMDEALGVYGIPDLLIKANVIEELFNIPRVSFIIPSAKGYYELYYVVDIKLSSINVGKSGIRNEGSIKAYKGQIYIYSKILDNLFFTWGDFDTPVHNPYGFLLGRRLILGEYDIRDGKKNLGLVDFDKESYIVGNVKDAISWINCLKKEGSRWNIFEPHRQELKPNMKNSNDYPWHFAKKMVADKQNDLTKYWNITSKMREEIIAREISPAEYFEQNVQNSNRKEIMTKMNEMLESEQKIHYTLCPEKCAEISRIINTKKLNFYVDFEFINGCDITFNHITRIHLYMIGVGYIDHQGKWIFRTFIPDKLSNLDEKHNIQSWFAYLVESSRQMGYTDFQLIHWSNAEPSTLNKLKEDFGIRISVQWIDLLRIYQDIQFICRGMCNYSLKSVANAMNKEGLILTQWKESVVDGLGANMIIINGLKSGNKLKELKNMEEVIFYNEIDCKVLFEMVSYLSKIIISVE